MPLFKQGQPAKKGLSVTSGKLEKDLGKDKLAGGAFGKKERKNYLLAVVFFAAAGFLAAVLALGAAGFLAVAFFAAGALAAFLAGAALEKGVVALRASSTRV